MKHMNDRNDRYDNDVFISYSMRQVRAAMLVRDVLRENLLSCWIAPECIPAGSDYTTEIPRAIHGCKAVVLILSSDAQRSQWVCSEINTAIAQKKIIIPFAVQNCKIDSQFDFAISKSQRIVAYKHLSSALEELVTAVYALVERDLVPVQRAYLKRRLRLYRRRRVILTAGAVLLAAAIFAVSAFALGKALDAPREQERFVSGTLGQCEWEYLEDDAELVIHGTGSTYVNGVSSPWADYAGEIRTLTVEDGVTELGFEMMADCTSLTKVSLPAGLIKIYGGAFSNCSSLAEITIPEGVTDIGMYAFSGCSALGTVRIPASVTGLDPLAFLGAKLSGFDVADENTKYSSADGVLFDKSGERLIAFPGGYRQTAYQVPDGVTEIGDKAFFNCTALREVTLPGSVRSIGENAFFGCSALNKVVFADGLTEIGKKAFSNTALQDVTLPASVTRVGEEAFHLCLKLRSVSIGSAVEMIESGTFFGCSHLTQVTLGPALKQIGSEAFKNCVELDKIAVPPTVTRIHDSAFEGCRKLTVIGEAGSEAERFANDAGFDFIAEQ